MAFLASTSAVSHARSALRCDALVGLFFLPINGRHSNAHNSDLIVFDVRYPYSQRLFRWKTNCGIDEIIFSVFFGLKYQSENSALVLHRILDDSFCLKTQVVSTNFVRGDFRRDAYPFALEMAEHFLCPDATAETRAGERGVSAFA